MSSSSSPRKIFTSTMGNAGAGSLGSWFFVAFFCLSLPSSLPVHTKEPSSERLTTNLNVCLNTSTYLSKVVADALHHFQETINCTLDQILPSNPNNEENIRKACIEGKSKSGFCLSVENDTVDEAQCMDTIYRILKRYEVKIKDFNSPKLLGTVNLMMKDLKTSHKITEQPSSTTQHPFERNFQKERDQCEILLILQQLAQTINRILRYRQSLEM